MKSINSSPIIAKKQTKCYSQFALGMKSPLQRILLTSVITKGITTSTQETD